MRAPSIKYLITAVTVVLWLAVPAPVLAAVNPSAQSAAAAGIQYLADNQQADGSISGYGGESEWTVEAIQAGGLQASTFTHGGSSLLDFLKTDVPPAGSSTTTLERNIIAIAAAGQNPASFGGVDYEALLAAQHIGGQIGDPTLLNDDIFGIIAIDSTHDASLLPEAQDALDYLLAHQGTDGGFGYSADPSIGSDNNDTAAALVALYAASDLGLTNANLSTAKTAALNYMLSTQQTDGGFGYDQSGPSDGDSTAWSIIALNVLGDSSAPSAVSARTWLLNDQNTDGGFSYGAFGVTNSDTYTTAHAVIALLGTTWLLNPTPLAITTQPSSPPSSSTSEGSTGKTTQTAVQTTTHDAAISGFREASANDGASPAAEPVHDTPAPQVKGASTTVHHAAAKTSDVKHTDHKSATYAVALLGLVAVLWFVLESRKGTKGNDEG